MTRAEIAIRSVYNDICLLQPDNIYLQKSIMNALEITKQEQYEIINRYTNDNNTDNP